MSGQKFLVRQSRYWGDWVVYRYGWVKVRFPTHAEALAYAIEQAEAGR